MTYRSCSPYHGQNPSINYKQIYDELDTNIDTFKFPAFDYPPFQFPEDEEREQMTGWGKVAFGILEPDRNGLYYHVFAKQKDLLDKSSYFHRILRKNMGGSQNRKKRVLFRRSKMRKRSTAYRERGYSNEEFFDFLQISRRNRGPSNELKEIQETPAKPRKSILPSIRKVSSKELPVQKNLSLQENHSQNKIIQNQPTIPEETNNEAPIFKRKKFLSHQSPKNAKNSMIIKSKPAVRCKSTCPIPNITKKPSKHSNPRNISPFSTMERDENSPKDKKVLNVYLNMIPKTKKELNLNLNENALNHYQGKSFKKMKWIQLYRRRKVQLLLKKLAKTSDHHLILQKESAESSQELSETINDIPKYDNVDLKLENLSIFQNDKAKEIKRKHKTERNFSSLTKESKSIRSRNWNTSNFALEKIYNTDGLTNIRSQRLESRTQSKRFSPISIYKTDYAPKNYYQIKPNTTLLNLDQYI